MSHSSELRTKLVQGIQELESDLDRLRAALAALDGGSSSSRRRRSRARPRRRSRRRNHGSEIVPAGKIESLLAASDGITTAELARETNGGHEQILSLLKELEQAGKAHRSGTRRSTRWHAGPAPARGRSNGSNGSNGSGAVAETQRRRRPARPREPAGKERVMPDRSTPLMRPSPADAPRATASPQMASSTCSCGCPRRWAATSSGTNPEQLFAVGLRGVLRGRARDRGQARTDRLGRCRSTSSVESVGEPGHQGL